MFEGECVCVSERERQRGRDDYRFVLSSSFGPETTHPTTDDDDDDDDGSNVDDAKADQRRFGR